MIEIEIKGTSKSGTSIIAKIISFTLNQKCGIETITLDEFGDIVEFDYNLDKDRDESDARKLAALSNKHQLGNEILIKINQLPRDYKNANTKLSNNE